MNKDTIKWVWSHRRKMSLHHLDIFVSGLVNNGFYPALNYMQKNQLAVVLPGNDTYLFDSERELERLYDSILEQSKSPTFTKRLFQRNDELFGSLLLLTGDIKNSNLTLYNDGKLLELYDRFIGLITQAPLIRIQLTGIDACWSKNSPLKNELAKKAKNEAEYKKWVGIISYFSGESVAKTEQIDFLLLADVLYKNKEIRQLLLKKKIERAKKIIRSKNKSLESMLVRHILKYEWVNSEYTGQKWDMSKWLEEISKFLIFSPLNKIKQIEIDQQSKSRAKENLVKKLQLSKKSIQIVDALDCFSSLRDWSKGYFVRALLDYRHLFEEISSRLNIDSQELLNFSVKEVRNIFEKKNLNIRELRHRKNSGAIEILVNGKKQIITNRESIRKIKNRPVIYDVLSKKDTVDKFTGKSAYPGIYKGLVKKILRSQDIETVKQGDILVTYMTTMEYTPVFKKIAALITDEGGISSHAAIISREFKIPCVTGTKIATRVLKTGDTVEVDANNGIITIVK